MSSPAENYDPSQEALFEDQGLDRCEECHQWYAPDGRDLHPGCPARATETKLIITS